ncbi:MAG: response regulator [Dongiaceae bacterium]
MNDDALIARLMQTFLGEAEEHVRALNSGLLALEKPGEGAQPPAAILKSLFRTAHSLKGAAHAVRATEIETACHRLEELFGAAQEGPGIAPAHFHTLFRLVDEIQSGVTDLRGRQAPAATPPSAKPARPEPAPAAATRQAPAMRTEGGAATSGQGPLIRLSAQKLDTLLVHSGEITQARRRAVARSEDAARLQELSRRWKSDWRSIERMIERQMDPERVATAAAGSGTAESIVHREQRGTAILRHVIAEFARFERDLQRLVGDLENDHRQLGRTAALLDSEVRRARMVPFAEACVGLDRVVRDLASGSAKQVSFVVTGSEIELDRSVLEGLKDPLLHLVRNASDHGIEPAELRRSRGKPAAGRITVGARVLGAIVEVTVADDGAGLDLDAIRGRLRQLQLPEPADDEGLARSIFLPAFSTVKRVTEISGRGVGLDAVRSRVEAMRGSVDVAFTPGNGACFVMQVPMTLLTIRALVIEAGGQCFGFDDTAIERLLRIDSEEIRSIEGRRVVAVGEAPVPLLRLAPLLDLREEPGPTAAEMLTIILLRHGDRRVAIEVDRLVAEQEIVLRSLGPRLSGLKLYAGGFSLPSGKIALVLNAAELLERAFSGNIAERASPRETAVATRHRLIVADDSVTTRTLEKSILEAAGYEVHAASDGAEAWRILQETGADLVVSDVEMPGMNGIELTRTIRNSARFRQLPVILVTGRESEADKLRGLEAGANAYLPKSAFDQTTLLTTIRQIL